MLRSDILVVSLVVVVTAAAACFGAPPIADYRDDFQGVAPATGWGYQWNSTGPVGNSSNYANLLWNGSGQYTTHGGSLPAPGIGQFGFLGATGGHPAAGIGQGAGVDRYVIANYTVQAGEQGPLAISGSLLSIPSTSSTGVDLQVYVNNTLQRQISYTQGGSQLHGFNTILGNINAGDTVRVAIGPRTDHSFDSFDLDFSVQGMNPVQTNVANYRDDYQAVTFPAGWRYQTNTNGAIGTPANYVDLLWNNADSFYDNDGFAGLPGPNPGQYVFLGATGGHPGPGPSDSISPARYAIAAYTVEEDGQYAILNSLINTLGTEGNGGEVYIHVNGDSPALHTFFPNATGDQLGLFDTFLGDLVAGDVIYVGVGPNGSHGNDNFAWDFDIVQFAEATAVPEPISLAAWGLLAVGGLATAMLRRRPRR
jgi:hypothetical protein